MKRRYGFEDRLVVCACGQLRRPGIDLHGTQRAVAQGGPTILAHQIAIRVANGEIRVGECGVVDSGRGGAGRIVKNRRARAAVVGCVCRKLVLGDVVVSAVILRVDGGKWRGAGDAVVEGEIRLGEKSIPRSEAQSAPVGGEVVCDHSVFFGRPDIVGIEIDADVISRAGIRNGLHIFRPLFDKNSVADVVLTEVVEGR